MIATLVSDQTCMYTVSNRTNKSPLSSVIMPGIHQTNDMNSK